MDSTEIKAQIEQENKGNAKALLPIAVFLLFFLGSGVIAKDFYAMPTIVAFLIALAVAFCQNPRLKFNDKIKVCTKGIGDENVVMMCFIFLTAGAFSGAVTAAGGADSTVYLGLSLIPSQFAVVGLFLIGCFISISMGTSGRYHRGARADRGGGEQRDLIRDAAVSQRGRIRRDVRRQSFDDL